MTIYKETIFENELTTTISVCWVGTLGREKTGVKGLIVLCFCSNRVLRCVSTSATNYDLSFIQAILFNLVWQIRDQRKENLIFVHERND